MDLEARLTLLEQKIDMIVELLKQDGKKMRDHIDFIERVYETIKNPFYYILDKINVYKKIDKLENKDVSLQRLNCREKLIDA